jgi:hypothetical protein
VRRHGQEATLELGGDAPCITLVWISEASPRQYSVDVLVKKIFGVCRHAACRSSNPSVRPVTVSVWIVSLNGNKLLILGCSDADG